MPETRFEIPKIITDRYAALCDLVENHSTDHTSLSTYWTQYNKLKESGIVPTIEREVS